MKNLILTIVLVFTGLYAAGATTSATSVLDKTAGKINKARSLTADYTISAGTSSEKGRLTLASGKFTLTSASLRIWYDGITMWTYSPSMNEVNVTTPTAEELMEINPFAIINSYKKQYTAVKQPAPKGSFKIMLTPKKNGPFLKAVITIDSTTYYPKTISLTMTDRSVIDIAIESVTAGNSIDLKAFTFKPADAPGAEIIDLR